jgi:hypothetical protein
MIILPLSLPIYCAKSATELASKITTSPFISPLVPGVQATGIPCKETSRGLKTSIEAESCDQPLPNSKGSK